MHARRDVNSCLVAFVPSRTQYYISSSASLDRVPQKIQYIMKKNAERGWAKFGCREQKRNRAKTGFLEARNAEIY